MDEPRVPCLCPVPWLVNRRLGYHQVWRSRPGMGGVYVHQSIINSHDGWRLIFHKKKRNHTNQFNVATLSTSSGSKQSILRRWSLITACD